jgi:RNA polymerase sigma factor (sigma-70 family)
MSDGGSTVFVVDDDPAMRESLRWLVESIGLRVQTYATAREFLDRYDAASVGCLVLDVRMPGLSGLDLQDELGKLGNPLPIIMITGYAEVPMAVRAMKGGAIDFIEKPFSDQDLLDRVRFAIDLSKQVRAENDEREEIYARVARLTPRELEVRDRVIAGMSNKVIAKELGLSTKTVEVHRARLMEKLQASTLADLVRLTLLAEGMRENPNQSKGRS